MRQVDCLPESALPPIADESLHRSETTRCANSGNSTPADDVFKKSVEIGATMMYGQCSVRRGSSLTGRTIVKARLIIAVAASLLLPRMAQATEIKLLASVAIKDAYLELLPQFEKATGHKVTAAWASTPDIQRRI